MSELFLVGIGTGNPEHLTLQAIRTLNRVDLILIPRKGDGKADLAELRRQICCDVVTDPATRIIEIDLPQRDPEIADYIQRVEAWHAAIARVWADAIAAAPPPRDRIALLVWGDPSLYDSTLRIAARLTPAPKVTVIPGITSLQGLTSAHAIALNDLGAPVVVTTGRRLRDEGWPPAAKRVAVMLDGDCAFETLDPRGVTIWWAAYAGMPQQHILSGGLAATGPEIRRLRAELRETNGWIMDIYILSSE